MSRHYRINDHGIAGYTLDLLEGEDVVGTLPFRGLLDAHEFGSEFVQLDPQRQLARQRHPAGKRRLAEPAV